MADYSRKRLFTPGPLNSSPAVLAAMAQNIGSREPEFMEVIGDIRRGLLAELADPSAYEAVLVPGSGTFGLESMLSSLVPRSDGRLLVFENGDYGRRLALIGTRSGLEVSTISGEELQPLAPDRLANALSEDPAITHVAAVHCETSTGLTNPIFELGQVTKAWGKSFLVDGMSSFGAIPLDLSEAGIDCLVSSSNKCLQGVPGFSFALVRREPLERSEGNAASLSLDLFDQWQAMEATGQFRFTPPTQVLLAFRKALEEFRAEGGVTGRGRRYRENHRILLDGMRALGFKALLEEACQGPIITSFHLPTDPRFDFDQFYRKLADRNLIIYPGKAASQESFRVGSIGHLFPEDMKALLEGITTVLEEMGLPIPLD